MASLNVADIVQITTRGTYQGNMTLGQVLYYVTVPSQLNTITAALQNLADAMRVGPINSWVGPYIAAAANNWTNNIVRAQRVYPQRSIAMESVDNRPGGAGVDAQTMNITGVITKRTIIGTRAGIGRLHTAPLPHDGFTNGLLTAGQMALHAAIGTAMIQTLTIPGDSLSIKPVLWSPRQPQQSIDLLSFTVQDTVRCLRRRTLRVGK